MKRVHRIFIILAVTVVIIAFFIYWPSYSAYRTRQYNGMAVKDLKNLYNVAQTYFQKNHDGTIDMESAKQYGFKPTYDVKLEIQRGQRMNFSATASHPKGTEMYTINNKGEIIGLKQAMLDR
jgi:hypothetical protein